MSHKRGFGLNISKQNNSLKTRIYSKIHRKFLFHFQCGYRVVLKHYSQHNHQSGQIIYKITYFKNT